MTSSPLGNAQTCYLRDSEMVFRRFGDEMVLVPVRKGIGEFNSFYVLNEVGYFLWEQLQEPKCLETLVHAVTEEFDVKREEAKTDIETFITELLDLNALIPVDQKGERIA